MALYNIHNDKLVIEPEILAVPELRKIWDRNKDKSLAEAELCFIWYVCDYKSPYQIYPESTRADEVRKDFMRGFKSWKPDKEVNEAMDKYIKLNMSKSLRLAMATKEVALKLAEYFENIKDFSETDDNGKPVYNIQEIIKNLSSIGTVIESLDKLDDRVKKEKEKDNIRGGGEAGAYEDSQ